MTQPTLSAYLTVDDATAAVDFYARALGAEEVGPRLTDPRGRIVHTEMRVGDSTFMLAEHSPEFGTCEPRSLGGTPVRMAVMTDDCDGATARASAAGARLLIEPANQFYGHRSARIEDPFGHQWIFSQEIESLDPAEMQRRLDAAFASG